MGVNGIAAARWIGRITARTVHAASCFEAAKAAPAMWRATFSGNPGATQTCKAKRWLAA